MGTVALPSRLKRLTLPQATACSAFFYIIEDRGGLFALLLGRGLDHLAQPKAHPMQDLGHGTGRGQVLRALALLAERLQCRLGCQARGG
jgi:hypothetical protein